MSSCGALFAEKVVWITGAASGVGAATARMFAHEGASLILSDRNADRVGALKDQLAEANNHIYTSIGDLREYKTAQRAGTLISERFGTLDLLVNCVGYNVPGRNWSELNTIGVDSVLQTNLAAPFYCALVALPFMRARRSGLLIHIASTDGLRVGVVGGPAYSASKHGLVAMSHSVNLEEAANGIRSCVICPGGIDTDFLNYRSAPPSAERRAKLLRPEDVADVIRYVASTPSTVRIDQLTITPVA